LLIHPKDEEVEAPPLSKVLVPLDGSELAEEALSVTTALARTAQLQLVLLRVAPNISTMYRTQHLDYVATAEAWLRMQASQYLNAIAEKLTGEGLEVATQVELGDPAPLIVESAARGTGTLIALTTHGRSGMGRWLLGSVADKVVRSAAGPVLLLRPDA
jgi:nucleotide-binding universal stress UspA family protein